MSCLRFTYKLELDFLLLDGAENLGQRALAMIGRSATYLYSRNSPAPARLPMPAAQARYDNPNRIGRSAIVQEK